MHRRYLNQGWDESGRWMKTDWFGTSAFREQHMSHNTVQQLVLHNAKIF